MPSIYVLVLACLQPAQSGVPISALRCRNIVGVSGTCARKWCCIAIHILRKKAHVKSLLILYDAGTGNLHYILKHKCNLIKVIRIDA